MAENPSSPDATHPTARRLKLVLKTSEESTEVAIPRLERNGTGKDESSSPPRPSFSPVTPTHSHEPPANLERSETQWIDEPPSLPVNLDDNADAIALRATISLLQMQRQQSLKNLKQLESMKREALEDPENFVKDLRQGKMTISTLDITPSGDDDEDTDDEHKPRDEERSKFGKIPNAQNVARCPPIEWSKYHILGKPLEAMHETQQRYPGISDDNLVRGLPLREHEITAPYRPFVDEIKPRKGNNGYDL